MSPIRFIRRLLLAAEEAVNASVDRALGEEVPLDDLLDSCPTCDAEDEEHVGDDTMRLFGDPDAEIRLYVAEGTPMEIAEAIKEAIDRHRAAMREELAGVAAAEKAEHLDTEWFDLSHDARTGGA